MHLFFSILVKPLNFIIHVTEKTSANNDKCASYSERVPCRKFSKMYDTRCMYTKVNS
jgi:hypothetical protein